LFLALTGKTGYVFSFASPEIAHFKKVSNVHNITQMIAFPFVLQCIIVSLALIDIEAIHFGVRPMKNPCGLLLFLQKINKTPSSNHRWF